MKNNNEQIKIMIIGDYLIFRNGLKQLIESESGLKIVSDTVDLMTAPINLTRYSPDVVIIDSTEVENPNFKTFFSRSCDGIPVLILTHYKDLRTHQNYLLLGASGVVTKEQSPEILFKAIRHVCKEDLWFDRKVLLTTISELVEERKDMPYNKYSQKYAALTEREWEVLKGVCQGMKNKNLAESLFIAETTVRHHLTTIFNKLNVKSRLALAILAFKDGVVEIQQEENVHL